MIWLILLLIVQADYAGAQRFGFMRAACPKNYVYVRAMAPYTTSDFCVMKYEARVDSDGLAQSVPTGTPTANIKRGFGDTDPGSARKACKDLGPNYALISNDQWQTIARDILAVSSNWSAGILGNEHVGFGNTNAAMASPAAVEAHEDDDQNCLRMTDCATNWIRRRTHTLSNKSIIWDFGGNLSEWVIDNNHTNPGTTAYASTYTDVDLVKNLGAPTVCSAPNLTPYCNFGRGNLGGFNGYATRGGNYSQASRTGGILAANTVPPASAATIGFRCVYQPMNHPDLCVRSTPAIGTACAGQALYAGIINDARYMITPGGCSSSGCTGSTDGTQKEFALANGTLIYPSDSDGAMNTAEFKGNSPAADFCERLTFGGHTDWFLPAKDELLAIYARRADLGGFQLSLYWTSTEVSATEGMAVNMSNGNSVAIGKTSLQYVRCVRRY